MKNSCIISASIVAPVDSPISPVATMGYISEDQKYVYKNDVQELQVEKLQLLETSLNFPKQQLQYYT